MTVRFAGLCCKRELASSNNDYPGMVPASRHYIPTFTCAYSFFPLSALPVPYQTIHTHLSQHPLAPKTCSPYLVHLASFSVFGLRQAHTLHSLILWLSHDVAWDLPRGSLYNDFLSACAYWRDILHFWRHALAIDAADHSRLLSEYPLPAPHWPIENCWPVLAVFWRTYTIGALPCKSTIFLITLMPYRNKK
jgi:hypothetical protein